MLLRLPDYFGCHVRARFSGGDSWQICIFFIITGIDLHSIVDGDDWEVVLLCLPWSVGGRLRKWFEAVDHRSICIWFLSITAGDLPPVVSENYFTILFHWVPRAFEGCIRKWF
jgi:hypothetical protein